MHRASWKEPVQMTYSQKEFSITLEQKGFLLMFLWAFPSRGLIQMEYIFRLTSWYIIIITQNQPSCITGYSGSRLDPFPCAGRLYATAISDISQLQSETVQLRKDYAISLVHYLNNEPVSIKWTRQSKPMQGRLLAQWGFPTPPPENGLAEGQGNLQNSARREERPGQCLDKRRPATL